MNYVLFQQENIRILFLSQKKNIHSCGGSSRKLTFLGKLGKYAPNDMCIGIFQESYTISIF